MLHPIILFDGDCHFCDSSVQFIIKLDPKGTFHFASLQSETGQTFLKKYDIQADFDSFILIENDKAYSKSTAALRVCRHLRGAWRMFYLFIIIPSPLRNRMYDFIAKNRYKWFGKKESCMLPPPEIRKRFLD